VKGFESFLIEDKRIYEMFVDRFSNSLKNTHKRVEIGQDNGLPIYLWKSYKPEYLITAGWQGDEPAGWNACMKLAEEGYKNLSFVPVVCPSAFVSGDHMDWQGVNNDRNFPTPSGESSKAMNDATETLVSLSLKGHFSLQEDPKRSFAYAYFWGNAPKSKVIEILDNGPRSGLVMWDEGERKPKQKGMFCQHLHNHGVPFSVQTETPADGSVSLDKRVLGQFTVVSTITQS